MELLSKFGLQLEHFLRVDILPPKLLASLRICLMDEELFRKFQADPGSNPFQMVTDENEASVFENLENILQGMLDLYGTSLEEDQDILNNGELSECKRLAVLYRKIHKKILVENLSKVHQLQQKRQRVQ
jgi:hypothetical protein